MAQTKKIRNPSLILSLVDRVSNSILLAHACSCKREGGRGGEGHSIVTAVRAFSEFLSIMSCHCFNRPIYVFLYINVHVCVQSFSLDCYMILIVMYKGINLGAMLFFREGMFI